MFLGIGVGRVYSGAVLPMFFALLFGFFAPENVSEKFSSCQVRCLNKFSGANFCFWVSVWVLCVLVLFCLCFGFICCFFAPETVSEKFSLMSGLVFLGCLLSSFGFFADVVVLVFFVFKRERSGSNRAHPHTHLGGFSCSFFVPLAFVCSPFLAVRPASWRFFGVPFWAPRVFWDSPGTYGA